MGRANRPALARPNVSADAPAGRPRRTPAALLWEGVALQRDPVRRVLSRARRARVELAPADAERLAAYLVFLSDWNRKINLTGLGDPVEAVDRLLIEPLAAARYLPASARRLLDVGSGAGSPAIPLKLVRPQLSMHLVEAKVRKSAFLREVCRRFSLGDVQVESCRFEELLTRPDLHEAMDVVTVRAVRIEAAALRSLQAFLKPGGRLLLFRAQGASPLAHIPQPLSFEAEHPLLENLRSGLTVLRKTRS